MNEGFFTLIFVGLVFVFIAQCSGCSPTAETSWPQSADGWSIDSIGFCAISIPAVRPPSSRRRPAPGS
jgi:hypothetical protein